MTMQVFYQRLSIKPNRKDQRKLMNLTHVSRAQVLNAASEDTWFLWWKPEESEN